MEVTMKSINTDKFRRLRSVGGGVPFRVVPKISARLVAACLFLSIVLSLRAEPVTADELSFFVRSRETDAFIVDQLTQRKMVRALSPKQEAALKHHGASESLLRTLREAKVYLSEADAVAFEKQQRELEKDLPQIAVGPAVQGRGTRPAIVPLPPLPSIDSPVNLLDAGAASGVDLIIEKIVIQYPPPLPGPYYMWLQAKTGRAEVTFNIPGKGYGSEVTTSAVEIPLNLRINNVRLQDWATVKVQVDKQDEAVRTAAALKKSTARIEITKDPSEKEFVGFRDENNNFVYQLKWYTVER
jgi:hypothetical protein